jgi:hypothetical protein
MAPENRRNVDNVRSIIRDVVSGGTFLGLIGLVFYAGQLVERFDNFCKAQTEINIDTNKRIISTTNDVSVLRDWKVASTQKPFYKLDNEK